MFPKVNSLLSKVITTRVSICAALIQYHVKAKHIAGPADMRYRESQRLVTGLEERRVESTPQEVVFRYYSCGGRGRMLSERVVPD